jgi:hypothetical protein
VLGTPIGAVTPRRSTDDQLGGLMAVINKEGDPAEGAEKWIAVSRDDYDDR